MSSRSRGIAPIGARLGDTLTVLDIIDGGSPEPVYMVWHRTAWAPMVCKAMRSHEAALREADLLKGLAHPNIVQVIAVVEPGYLLMPYLEGPRLGDVIDSTPKKQLRIPDALRVAVHIGAALNHVHVHGYVYLDVKPDNVIVTPGGRPVLFDFGTARALSAPRPGEVIGTNDYIAPEECRQEDAGPPADVFSLAVMLFEMLGGTHPFPKASGGVFPQTAVEPRSLRALRPGVPAKLENLIFACLEKNPSFRPELAELLPALNDMITRGPRMWPDGFRPDRAPKSQACRTARSPYRSGGFQSQSKSATLH